MPPAPVAMRLFVLSANDEEAAKKRAQQLGVYLEQHPGVFEKHLVRNIAYTLCNRRSHLSWRSATVGSTTADLAQGLNGSNVKPSRALRNPKIAFVFTGQGAQWHAMGSELMATHDVFAASIKQADETLKALGATWSLVEELSRSKEDTQVNKAYLSQPICTAVQVALVDLLCSWNIRPSSVIGHSSGEIGAAYAAGALTAEGALSAAYNRGRAVAKMIAEQAQVNGSMLAVGAGKDTVAPMIKMLREGKCTIACENSPNSVTVSGDTAAIDELAAELEKSSTFNRKLKVEVAYHSQHMEAVADYYHDIIKDLAATSTDVAFFSSLKGELLKDTSQLNAEYWVQNLTHPVLFSTALQELCRTSEPDVLVEIGPHAALEGPIKHVIKAVGEKASKIAYFPSLKRDEDATRTMLTLGGNLFKKGANLDFSRVNPDILSPKPTHISNFAPYPWSGLKCWRESRVSRQHRLKPFPRHDLLGLLGSLSSDLEPSWRSIIRTDDIPWLRDHKMQELTAFPFSGFVSMGVEAASQRASMRGVDFDQFNIREMQVTRPLLMQDGEDYELITNLRQYSEGTRSYSDKWDEFRVHSYHEDRGWTEHCRGLIGVSKHEEANQVCTVHVDESAELVAKAKQVCKTPLPTTAFYSELRDRGAGYGPTLQNILSISADDDFEHGIGEVVVPDTAATMPEKYQTNTIINAAFLDLLFQHTFVVLGAGRGAMPCLYMPSAVGEIQIQKTISSEAGEPFDVYVKGKTDLTRPKSIEVLIQAINSRNPHEPAIVIKAFELTAVKDDNMNNVEAKTLGYKTLWTPLNGEEALVEAQAGDVNNAVVGEVHETAQAVSVSEQQATTPIVANGEDAVNEVAINGVPINGGYATNEVIINGHHDTNGVVTSGHHDTNRAVSNGVTVNGVTVNGAAINAVTTNGHHVTNGVVATAITPQEAVTNGVPINGDHPTNGLITNGHHDTNGAVSNGGAVTDAINGDHASNGVSVNNHHADVATANADVVDGVSVVKDIWSDLSVVLLTERSETDPLLSALAANIELRTGHAPTISSLDKADVAHKTCINLYELDCSMFAQVTAETFDKIQRVLLGSDMFLWVTSGAYKNAQNPHRNMAQGLTRTIRSESGKQIATLDLCASSGTSGHDQALLIMETFQHMVAHQSEEAPDMEFAEDNGRIVVPRIVEDSELNTFIQRETQFSDPYLQPFNQSNRRLKLDIERPGALDTLYFTDDALTDLDKDEVEILVEATGMNFKDVVISMGQLASPYIGVECSGTIARVGSAVTSLAVGDRVCAMPVGAYRTFARCLATSAAKIPDDMTMEVAASIPVAYCTAYYGLLDIARLEANERVLIHAAAGGVGQCAIQLAQMVGAEVFATVGSVDKKRLIMDKYGIAEDHIFNSRNTSFGPAIRAMTKGEGVDVVLNSLAGELLRETWDCIAHFGRFIEIGKRDISNNTRLEMKRFDSNALFSSVDLTVLAAERPRIMSRVMKSVMDALETKKIGPMYPITAMGISDVEKALRLLQGGKTTGKLVLTHGAQEQVKATHPRLNKNMFSENGSYIVLGGTGGLGRSIAKWMVNKGAGNVVLVSRSGTNQKVEELIQKLGTLGSKIQVKSCDIANASSVDALVRDCSVSLAPVRGVIHATMVLRVSESMAMQCSEQARTNDILGHTLRKDDIWRL